MESKQADFLINFQSVLDENNLTEAILLLQIPNNVQIVRENVWEVLPLIAKFIGSPQEKESNNHSKILQLLDTVSEICSPEDMLLGIHKEMCDANTIIFITFLPALKKAMINLPKSKIDYTIWCFAVVDDFLNNLDLPANYALVSEESKNQDSDVNNIIEIYTQVAEFYTEIVHSYKNSQITLVLAKYLLQLLGRPLVYLDLTENSKALRAANIIVHLLRLLIDPYKCLKWKSFKCEANDLEVKKLALGHLFYLIIAKHVEADFLPRVYCNLHIFHNCLRFVPELLSDEHNLVIEKGLCSAEALIGLNSAGSLEHILLDDPVHSNFCITLSNVIIFSSVKPYRQKGLEILKRYILLFSIKGRYLLIYNLFKNVKHSGLLGYLITLYKDMLIEEFKKSDEPGEFFRGSKLHNILDQFCYLEKNEETDLLEQADKIVPTLNFLRFLAIRDKENKTNVLDYFAVINENYLDHLKQGLKQSKFHYNSRILELEKTGSNGDKVDTENQVSVNVGGEYLPNMSCVEEINMCRAAITGFDVMESLLVRVFECIHREWIDYLFT